MTAPLIIDALVAAVNAKDTDGFLALFAADGQVDYRGEIYKGQEAIRHWSDNELIGAGAKLGPRRTSSGPSFAAMTVAVEGPAYRETEVFTIQLHDELITEMAVIETQA